MIGLANGVVIANNVAEIIQVQTKIYIGSGRITIIGEFTDSIMDSVKNSLNYLKTFIDISTTDINIIIEGSKYPLSGSSLGLTIYSSIYSALTNTPIENIVFTGAITPEGEILPVGGMDLKRAKVKSLGLKLITNK